MRTLDTLIVAPHRAGCKRYPSAMDWQALQDKFANLVAEEQAYYAGMGGRSMCAMGVYEDSDEFGRWTFSDAASERLLARFQLLATEAGIALQPPPGILPVDYWLHSLRNHLRSTESHYTSIGDERGGPIMSVMEASALYCTRLQIKELGKTVLTTHGAIPTPTILSVEKPNAIRASGTITSRLAVERMDAYRNSKGLGLTEFASLAGTTDRTLRTFRRTGKVRRDILKGIASALGTTLEELLKSDERKVTGK